MTQNSSTTAIRVAHLRKTYGNVKAVEDVSFVVHKGEIFGMLGPNGAGKTTTVECITGLRHPDGGTISVLGLNPQVDGDALHPVVGVQLQSSTFPDKLKVTRFSTCISPSTLIRPIQQNWLRRLGSARN